MESFDPLKVPTISQLTDEIDAFSKEGGSTAVSKDWKKTSLREPIKIFEEFLAKYKSKTEPASGEEEVRVPLGEL